MSVATLPRQADIEALYANGLGDEYLRKHPRPDARREPFWRGIVRDTTPKSVLEVGCGSGGNLAYLDGVPHRFGVDVHEPSLQQAVLNTGGKARLFRASATELPFPDRSMDLVVTAGCLIHIAEDALFPVLKELGRVSAKYVLLVEYVDTHRRAIPWRGHEGVLFADAFHLRFWRANPGYAPVWRRLLRAEQGFDRTEAALFERREGV